MMTRIKDRSTVDLLVIFITALAGILVVVILGILLYEVVTDPSKDISKPLTTLAGIAGTLIAAVLGFVAGRGSAPHEEE